MQDNHRRFVRARLLVILMCGVSSAALAQAPVNPGASGDQVPESVVVTGTLLKGTAPVGNHLLSFDATDIQAIGASTPTEVLANVPQISNLFGRDPATSTFGGQTAQPAAAIRNLPAGSTLVLIDGHNVVGNGALTTATDLSVVPQIVMQRADVVLDGGSAIYGSNAVGGTVNFITRKSFDGVQIQSSYGTTGNYDSFDLGLIGGRDWNSGSAYIAYEYHYNTNQRFADLSYGRQNLIPLGGTLDSRSTACSLPNVTAGASTYALSSNAVPNTPGGLAAAASLGINKCDTVQQFLDNYPADTQNIIWGRLNQHIAQGVDLTVTANWQNRSTISLIPQLATVNGTITNANPFFQSINGETKQTVSFSYSPIFGNTTGATVKLYQIGLTPELAVHMADDWDLTLMGNFQRSDVDNSIPQAPAPVAVTALTSSDPNYALDPYNLGLSPGAVLHQIVDFTTRHKAIQKLEQVGAQINGTAFQLPAGQVKLAVGAQYRYDSTAGVNVTGPLGQLTPPAVAGGVFIPGSGHRSIWSTFGEALVPLVSPENNISFVRSLEVDFSARYDHYSDFGDTTNPKIGVTYEPITGFKIRGNIGTAFVAPSLDDGAGAIDTRAALSPTSPARLPISISGRTAAQDAIDAFRPYFIIAGGSAGLQPEKANTRSIGFDYTPDFIPGLDVGFTIWHVSFSNLIGIVPANPSILYTTPVYQQYYTLFPTLAQLKAKTAGMGMQGFTSYDTYYQNGPDNTPYQLIDLRRHNLGNQFDEGLDLHIAYTLPTDFGSLDLGLDGTTFTMIKSQAFAGGALTDLLANNTSPYSLATSIGVKWGSLTARVRMQYLASYTVTGVVGQTRVSSFEPVSAFLGYDLDGTWDALSGSTISLNVNNLFDETPPFVNQGNGYTNGATLGRYFQFTLVKRF